MKKLKAGVVGLRMGRNHIAALGHLENVELTAICDIDEELAAQMADLVSGKGVDEKVYSGPVQARPKIYTDFSQMIREENLDIVTVATPNRFHAAMTMEASEAGVKAVCCEKPIAVNLKEAREMTACCRANGTRLIVNHQRRLGPDFTWMREQIESGALGDVYLIRGNCAGDFLSDGTHLIDSALFLTGDRDWKWVFASMNREDYEKSAGKGEDKTNGGGFDKTGGWRFGHPVEDGMFALVELETGLKIELLTGNLRDMPRPYHDLEIIGTKGALWRSGDRGNNLFRRGRSGEWEGVTLSEKRLSSENIQASYERLLSLLEKDMSDSEHPLGQPFTMRGFELLMGIYESARVGKIITSPVTQNEYPLALMLGL